MHFHPQNLGSGLTVIDHLSGFPPQMLPCCTLDAWAVNKAVYIVRRHHIFFLLICGIYWKVAAYLTEAAVLDIASEEIFVHQQHDKQWIWKWKFVVIGTDVVCLHNFPKFHGMSMLDNSWTYVNGDYAATAFFECSHSAADHEQHVHQQQGLKRQLVVDIMTKARNSTVCYCYKQQCLPAHPGSEHANDGILCVTS